MPELKPCPFCGNNNPKKLFVDIVPAERKPGYVGYHYAGYCSCGTAGPIAKTKEEAIAAWNKRTEAK